MEPLHFTAFARATSVYWQDLLRQSVRLYLTLGDTNNTRLETEAALRRVESQLVHYLLQGAAASQLAIDEAWAIVEAAQTRLLGSEPEVASLLAEYAVVYCAGRLAAPVYAGCSAPQSGR